MPRQEVFTIHILLEVLGCLSGGLVIADSARSSLGVCGGAWISPLAAGTDEQPLVHVVAGDRLVPLLWQDTRAICFLRMLRSKLFREITLQPPRMGAPAQGVSDMATNSPGD